MLNLRTVFQGFHGRCLAKTVDTYCTSTKAININVHASSILLHQLQNIPTEDGAIRDTTSASLNCRKERARWSVSQVADVKPSEYRTSGFKQRQAAFPSVSYL